MGFEDAFLLGMGLSRFIVAGKLTTNLGFSQPTRVIRGSTDEGGNRPPCRWPRTFVWNMFHQSTHSKVMENHSWIIFQNHPWRFPIHGTPSFPPCYFQIFHEIHHPASLGIPPTTMETSSQAVVSALMWSRWVFVRRERSELDVLWWGQWSRRSCGGWHVSHGFHHSLNSVNHGIQHPYWDLIWSIYIYIYVNITSHIHFWDSPHKRFKWI